MMIPYQRLVDSQLPLTIITCNLCSLIWNVSQDPPSIISSCYLLLFLGPHGTRFRKITSPSTNNKLLEVKVGSYKLTNIISRKTRSHNFSYNLFLLQLAATDFSNRLDLLFSLAALSNHLTLREASGAESLKLNCLV